jgi:CRP-like cAMP-binding protein
MSTLSKDQDDPLSDLFPAFFPQALREAARLLEIRRDDTLFRLGDRVCAVYQVIRGEVRMLRYAPNGSEIFLHRARRGEYFAEASLSSERYHCNAVCVKPGRVLMLPVEVLRTCLLENSDFALRWVLTLARNLRTLRARFERLSLKGAQERVLHYLVTERGEDGTVVLDQPIKAWAADLGVAHETLYRTLAEMESRGLLERQGRTLRLRGDSAE